MTVFVVIFVILLSPFIIYIIESAYEIHEMDKKIRNAPPNSIYFVLDSGGHNNFHGIYYKIPEDYKIKEDGDDRRVYVSTKYENSVYEVAVTKIDTSGSDLFSGLKNYCTKCQKEDYGEFDSYDCIVHGDKNRFTYCYYYRNDSKPMSCFIDIFHFADKDVVIKLKCYGRISQFGQKDYDISTNAHFLDNEKSKVVDHCNFKEEVEPTHIAPKPPEAKEDKKDDKKDDKISFKPSNKEDLPEFRVGVDIPPDNDPAWSYTNPKDYANAYEEEFAEEYLYDDDVSYDDALDYAWDDAVSHWKRVRSRNGYSTDY